MKPSLCLIPAAALAAAPALAQQAQPAPGPQDGSLTRATFIAQMDAEFAAFDTDRNGQVTIEEIGAYERRMAQAEALRQNRVVFDELDVDRNGTLSADEFAKLANPGAIPTDPAPLMGMLDLNKDGMVTLVENRAATQANFDRIDIDRDGVITEAEMRAGGIIK